jgi:Flp pilus assembly protein protease CpaA
MANEGSSGVERTVSFIIRLVVSLLLPAWGLVMIVLGVASGIGWWIATGLVVLAIGVVLFAGSSLVTPFLGGRWGS